MNRTAAFAITLLAGLPVSSLLAQNSAADRSASPPPSSGFDPVSIHTAAPDSGNEYGTWAAGDDYKVSFHDGMTFVPYLGREYPKNQPWSFRTTSVRVGEIELLARDERPTPVAATGKRYEYRYGAVTEAYDVRRDGVEQTFVLQERPTTAGPLCIEGRVTSDLVAPNRAATHAPIVFTDTDGAAITSYGAAIAIDAAGRERAMTTSYSDGKITLELDAAWLATAAFPLVVDPLLGVFHQTAGNAISDVDILHDPQGPSVNIWQAATRWASANDSDLFLRRVNDNGSALTVYADISSAWSTLHPSLGQHRIAQVVLLAFARQFFTQDVRRVRFHKHLRTDLTLSTNYGYVHSGLLQAHRPDVGSDSSPLAPTQELLIAYQREDGPTFYETTTSAIDGVVVDLAGTYGTAGTPFVIHDEPFDDAERPVVGELDLGGGQNWPVGHQVISVSQLVGQHPDWDVILRRVDRFGTISLPTIVGQQNGEHEMAPKLAGRNGEQMLAYTRSPIPYSGFHPTSVVGNAIVNELRLWNGVAFARPFAPNSFYFDQTPRCELGGITMNLDTRSHYATILRHTDTTNIEVLITGFSGAYLDDDTVFTGAYPEFGVASAVCYDERNDAYLLNYATEGTGHLAKIDRWVHPTAPAMGYAGTGCGQGNVSWQGSQLIGDAGCAVSINGIDAGAFATVVIGTQPMSTALPNAHPFGLGCMQLVPTAGPGALVTLPIAIGPASYPINLPEFLPAGTLYFQGLYLDDGNTTLKTSSRLEVPLVK